MQSITYLLTIFSSTFLQFHHLRQTTIHSRDKVSQHIFIASRVKKKKQKKTDAQYIHAQYTNRLNT